MYERKRGSHADQGVISKHWPTFASPRKDQTQSVVNELMIKQNNLLIIKFFQRTTTGGW